MDRGVTAKLPLRYPDFICIGAQKAGTTWLHGMLSQHRDVWLPPVKELHYFDCLHLDHYRRNPKRGPSDLDVFVMESALQTISNTIKNSQQTLDRLKKIYTTSLIGTRELSDEWYGRIFQSAPATSLCGEITPAYALLPDKGIEHMVALRPEMRIIFIMRDPIDRGWSDLRMTQKKRGEKADGQLLGRIIGSKEFFGRADYFGTVERFRRHVGEKNFLPVYFDRLTEQPREVLTEICEFLGVDVSRGKFQNIDDPIHKGESKPMDPELYDRMRTNLLPAYKRLQEWKNPVVEKWYKTHYS